MSMKLETIIERCGNVDTKNLKKKPIKRKRVTIMQAIYALYIVEAINLVATLVLWFRVFFLHSGGN